MSDRAFTIAAQARRFALLADRPQLLYPDRDERAERVLADDTKAAMDMMLLGGAGEADRVCAAAVAALKGDAPGKKAILSLLSVLPADYLLGVYFALPKDRRGQCGSDEVWAWHIGHAPDGVGEAQETLRGLAESDLQEAPEHLLEAEEAVAYRRFTDNLLRRTLGLANDLSDEEAALAAAGEAALSDVADGN